MKALKTLNLLVALSMLLFGVLGCSQPTPAPNPVPAPQAAAPAAPAAAQPTAVPATKAPAAPAAPTIKGGPLEVGVQWAEGSAYFDKIVKPIGDQLEKDFPGTKVTYTFNNTDARPSLEMRMKAGDPLDVDINLFDGSLPSTWTWLDQGFVMDLTSQMTAKRADGTMWKDDFPPLFQAPMQKDGKFYGAAEQVFLMLLHYNKKLFDEWGLKPPTTWAELLQTCETIKQKSGGKVAPIAVTGKSTHYMGQWWDYLLQRSIGTKKVNDYLFGDNSSTIANDPDFLKVAEEYAKLSKNGYLIDGWQGVDFTTAQVYFFQGKAAMMMMGSWLMTEMKQSIPEGFQLAVAPFPAVEGGKGNQNAMFGRVIVWNIPAKSKNPELAIEYLRRFTGRDSAQKRVDLLGAVSPHKDVPPPQAIIGADSLVRNVANNEFVIYYWGTVQAKYGLRAAWYDPLVDLWSGTATPQQTLAKIDANIAAVRAQRKAGQ